MNMNPLLPVAVIALVLYGLHRWRGAELWVQVECDGQILHERLVSSPREALRTAAVWKRRVGAAKIASA